MTFDKDHEFGTVLRNEGFASHGVMVMVVHWMEPMFLGVVLDDGRRVGATGWRGDAPNGFLGLIRVSDDKHIWSRND